MLGRGVGTGRLRALRQRMQRLRKQASANRQAQHATQDSRCPAELIHQARRTAFPGEDLAWRGSEGNSTRVLR